MAEQSRAMGLFLVRIAEPRQLTHLASQSEEALMKCLPEIRDDPKVYEALGVACLIQSRQQKAIEMWLESLKLSPDQESVNWRLGTLFHDTGQFEEGRKHLLKVVQQNPGRAEALGRLAHIYGRLGQIEQGIEFAERAIKSDPSLTLVYGWLAEAHSQLGHEAASRQARQMYDRLRDRIDRMTTPAGR